MARPKKVKYEIEQRYLDEALRLARSYPELLREKTEIEKDLNNDNIYTEDMAVLELLGGGFSYDMERVQTSNISKPAERIAILLADGYVEKRKREILDELRESYSQVCEKIYIVEIAIAERMEERTQTVFRQIFAEHKPYKKVRYSCENECQNKVIKREIDKAIRAIAETISLYEFMGGKSDGEK